MNTNNLPPLPEPFIVLDHTPGAKLAWGAQMREYGQLCRQQALEEAAVKAESEHVGTSVNDRCYTVEDESYNAALRHASEAIRSMK